MKIECTIENAPKLAQWLNDGRGLALWRCADLGNPGKTWTTPARNVDGTPTQPCHWSMEKQPAIIVESAEEVTVFIDKEVKRFRVGLKRGYGYCTDAASRRIKKAVADAGDNAYYTFDYDTQEAVIMKPTSSMTLGSWLAGQKS